VDAHSPGVMGELSFDVSESRYSVRLGFCASFSVPHKRLQDLAADLSRDAFKWRWETFSIGPKQSADVLSKHLTLPLLSTVCMALMSPAAISEIPGSDLEKVGFSSPPPPSAYSRAPSFDFGAGLKPPRLMSYHGVVK